MTGTDGGMPEKGKLSRREFLRLSKAVLGLLIFAACGPEPTQIPSVTGTSAPPPETPVLPPEAPVSQSTPIPTKPLSPIFPPIDEPIPQPTPIVEGPTVPGETLNIGGADLELKTTSGKELAAQIGAEEKGWKIVADENENSSFFTGYAGEEGKEVQVVFLAQAPEGYQWDSENMVWKHDDQVFIPDILLPGGWDTDKQMAGPAHEADEVFLFKDNSNYRIGIIYSKEKMPEIPDKSKLEILPDGSGLYVSDPKTITLDNGQQITRDLNENLRLVNPDGSYLLKRTSWGNVKSEEQIYQAVAFAGLVEAIPEAPYPGEKLTQEAITPFANAFGVTPEEVETLTPQLLTGVDGKQFVVMTTEDLAATAAFDESNTPLLIAEQGENGEWGWTDSWPRKLADANNLILEAPMISSDKNVDKIANQLLLTGELDASSVYKRFTKGDWQKIIDNWTEIQTQLNTGKIPKGFSYDWSSANNTLDYAISHNMTVRAQHLLWGGDVPDSVYYGGFTEDQIRILAEFMVKTRVLQYNGVADSNNQNKDLKRQVNQWDIADEWGATQIYPHDKWPFWLTNLGFPGAIADVSRWVTEANPNAEQVIIEDAMLYLPSERSHWRSKFMTLLNYVKQNNIPVSRVGIENNFSVFNPPPISEQEKNLRTIMNMGFGVTSETTVVTGNDKGIWVYERVQTPEDPMLAQANIYGDNLKVYLNAGADQYGLGGISNASEWYIRAGINDANSMILDRNYQPTPAFYRILQVLYSNLQ